VYLLKILDISAKPFFSCIVQKFEEEIISAILFQFSRWLAIFSDNL